MWCVEVSILDGFYKTSCIFFSTNSNCAQVLQYFNCQKQKKKDETIVLVQLEPALTSCSGTADCFVRPSLCHLSEGNYEK